MPGTDAYDQAHTVLQGPGWEERMAKVTADMTIAKILEICPDAKKIFMRHGMYCIGCAVGQTECLNDAAETHQIDLESLLRDLNKEE